MSRWETTSDESHLPGAPLGHRHLIEQTESGGCRLVNTIYLEGALAPLWRRIMGPAAARTLPTHSTPSSILLPGAAEARDAGRSADGHHHARHRVPHEARLLVPLDLEGEAGHCLPPAAALLFDREDLGLGADLGVDRDGRWEADLVPAVVDAEGEAGGGDQFLAKAVDQGEGEVAVGDRRAEGALRLGALDVDVDPLVVAGEAGEGVDVLLGDAAPLARADLLPEQGPHALDPLYLDGCHRAAV